MADSRRHPGGLANLGGTQVARIGFGAMQLERAPRDRALTVLRDAVDAGVDHIDTAEFYGEGVSNRLIREALHPYPEYLVIASKVGARREGSTFVSAQRPDELRADVEANLASLRVDTIPVVNLRRTDGGLSVSTPGSEAVAIEDQLAEMIAMRDEGMIGGIGLSNVTADQLRSALPAGIVCVQNSYNLLDRSAAPVLEICRAESIAWVPFFPLGSAFDRFPNVADNELVIDTARSLGVTPAQVGLAWLLADYENTLLIPGTSDPVHLAENLAAGDLRLDGSTLAALDAVQGAVSTARTP